MKKDLDIQIGLRIREKREERKISREQLAENINISPQFLAQIELGSKGMSSETLYKVCSALSVSCDYIVLGKVCDNNSTLISELIQNIEPQFMPYVEDLLKTFILAINKRT